MSRLRRRAQKLLLTAPSFIWLSLFFLVPTALVFILAFRPADPQYLTIALRTLWVSFVSTAICMFLAVPTGYAVARASDRRRNALLYLCPNKGAYPLLSEEIRTNPGIFLAPEIQAKCEVPADLGENNALYVKVWDEIKK